MSKTLSAPKGVLLGAVLVVATILSGCSAKRDANAAGATDEPTFDTETGAIQGVVLADDGLPIADASVGLGGQLDAAKRTADDGTFHFGALVPGAYVVIAQSLRYETAQEAVQVTAGAIAPVEIRLTEAPVKGLSYKVALEPIPGHFACGLGVPGLSGNCKVFAWDDPEHPAESAWKAATGGDTNQFDFEKLLSERRSLAEDHLSTIVIEVDWTPGTAAANTLWLSAIQYRDNGVDANGTEPATYGTAKGGPGLRLDLAPGVAGPYGVEIPNAVTLQPTTQGLSLTVYPFADPDPVVLPLSQDFRIWITLFYNGPAPDGYTAR